MTATAGPASLEKICAKQGQTHGLTHTSDDTFAFFLSLDFHVQSYHSASYFHLYASETFNHTQNLIMADDNLIKKWLCLSLFPAQDAATGTDVITELEAELATVLKLDMYQMPAEHLLKVSFAENLYNFK